ncbi:MAG: flavin reductase family protein [Prevotellaceae bacterium]|jgi:flavin reductase (DIM6/NTAB) family NADH-FMN oxidoreductase RutF|nr:flavin reductase family protein [Prevotellaceae bacterium]
MNKIAVLFMALLAAFSCSNTQRQAGAPHAISYEGVKDKSFGELFRQIDPNAIAPNIIALVQKEFIVITAGRERHYNAMVAGDGGVGVLMGKPVTFCGLRGSRYTLEVILKDSVYTFSFFDEQFKDDFMIFGQQSGRDTQKMQQTKLTAVATPSGKMTFKEAKIVIECTLAQTHTVNPEEVYAEHNSKFFTDAYQEVGSWHKIVFGDITSVWVRK